MTPERQAGGARARTHRSSRLQSSAPTWVASLLRAAIDAPRSRLQIDREPALASGIVDSYGGRVDQKLEEHPIERIAVALQRLVVWWLCKMHGGDEREAERAGALAAPLPRLSCATRSNVTSHVCSSSALGVRRSRM